MVKLHSITTYLNSLLEPSAYKDAAYNGLQVEAANENIAKVGVAVDAASSIFEQAAEKDCDLLIVHHGLFWGGHLQPITGRLGSKIRYLLDKNISLYASHLPLDANKEVGNGYELARLLNLEKLEPFCEYEGKLIGVKGQFPSPLTLEEIVELSAALPGRAQTPDTLFAFGPERMTSVGVVTGSGSFAIEACANEGLDLLISGEPKHEAYHLTKELGKNALFLGHYATETTGVRAIAKRLERDFDVQTVFLDEPTGV